MDESTVETIEKSGPSNLSWNMISSRNKIRLGILGGLILVVALTFAHYVNSHPPAAAPGVVEGRTVTKFVVKGMPARRGTFRVMEVKGTRALLSPLGGDDIWVDFSQVSEYTVK